MYVLILTLFMYADGGYTGQGGASVAVEKFASEYECRLAKQGFLSMEVTNAAITGSHIEGVRIAREAKCVSLFK